MFNTGFSTGISISLPISVKERKIPEGIDEAHALLIKQLHDEYGYSYDVLELEYYSIIAKCANLAKYNYGGGQVEISSLKFSPDYVTPHQYEIGPIISNSVSGIPSSSFFHSLQYPFGVEL